MRPPLTYYGGKVKMLPHILPVIPPHNLYVEPFFGGGAVFWNKEKSLGEVINDTNSEIINFYAVVQKNFKALDKEIQATLHSRYLFEKARRIHEFPELFTEVKRAWATWVLCNQSFAGIMGGAFGYDVSGHKGSNRIDSKKKRFVSDLAKRLEKVCIECHDALHIIKTRDRKETFFYLDPPYFNSHLGHYKGYTEADFEGLLKQLSTIQGKFLLSSYPSPLLTKFIKKYQWHTKSVAGRVSINKGTGKDKTEVLTANYPI
ncbi:MAG: DNA adenine methylase [Chitinophagales bacterium]|jgi:DNA adenine methylase|nr:DNA adenine methylase [Sphingobacteriales bacterium]